MAIKFYNYLTKTKEEFKPIKDNQVGLYTCGPTVYDRVHIGNLRTYIFEDILKRILNYNGLETNHIMNITDVEDKIIKKMQSENKTLEEVTEPYTEYFYKDLEKLNIKKADKYPKATEYIEEMIRLISTLLEKEIAYKSDDGSIYFNISRYQKYGKFSNLKKENIKHGARIKGDEYEKENLGDFVLWKAVKEGEPSWDAPFGNGRPGWHIECSAMSMKYLGETFDIHAGAVDLIFPHHENEIAQSEAVTGKKFVNFWMEGEHLLVDNKKMSKSLGNFYTLENIENKGFSPLAFRYLMLSTHYRNKINFTWESLASAQKGLDNLKRQISELGNEVGEINEEYKKEFTEKINDDLNAPQALAVSQKLVKSDFTNEDKLATVLDFDKVLGLELEPQKIEVPDEIQQLANDREKARQGKDWEKADELRKKIEKKGWLIKDTKKGSEIKPS